MQCLLPRVPDRMLIILLELTKDVGKKIIKNKYQLENLSNSSPINPFKHFPQVDSSILCLFIERQSTKTEGGTISVILKLLILTEG